uniref:Uncharacterized protein n=1 Tax=viral metagenome TaxID=1070528 RepID=A0A6C0J9B2_9ZZZZ
MEHVPYIPQAGVYYDPAPSPDGGFVDDGDIDQYMHERLLDVSNIKKKYGFSYQTHKKSGDHVAAVQKYRKAYMKDPTNKNLETFHKG